MRVQAQFYQFNNVPTLGMRKAGQYPLVQFRFEYLRTPLIFAAFFSNARYNIDSRGGRVRLRCGRNEQLR